MWCGSNPDDYEFCEYSGSAGKPVTHVVPKTAPQALHELRTFSNIVLDVKTSGQAGLVPQWPRIALLTQVGVRWGLLWLAIVVCVWLYVVRVEHC
jgi:hypothetical protein